MNPESMACRERRNGAWRLHWGQVGLQGPLLIRGRLLLLLLLLSLDARRAISPSYSMDRVSLYGGFNEAATATYWTSTPLVRINRLFWQSSINYSTKKLAGHQETNKINKIWTNLILLDSIWSKFILFDATYGKGKKLIQYLVPTRLLMYS